MKIKPVDGMKDDANTEFIILLVITVVFVAVDLLTGDPCDNRCGKMEWNRKKLRDMVFNQFHRLYILVACGFYLV